MAGRPNRRNKAAFSTVFQISEGSQVKTQQDSFMTRKIIEKNCDLVGAVEIDPLEFLID